MFTGVIEKTGVVESFQNGKLTLTHPWTIEDLKQGQSIAINGCCLTVVDFDDATVVFDVTTETISRTSFAALQPGDEVNFERPLQFGSSLDGHMLTGHIDSTGVVRQIEKVEPNGTKVWIDPCKTKLKWLVEKGSVSVDGVSLTVNQLDERGFSVMLIPHTISMTSLKNWKVGDFVNLEFDLLAKYVERILDTRKTLHV